MNQPPPPTCPPNFIIEVSFECQVCGRDTPARDGRRVKLDGLLGPVDVDVCPECYLDGVEDGIIAPID